MLKGSHVYKSQTEVKSGEEAQTESGQKCKNCSLAFQGGGSTGRGRRHEHGPQERNQKRRRREAQRGHEAQKTVDREKEVGYKEIKQPRTNGLRPAFPFAPQGRTGRLGSFLPVCQNSCLTLLAD